MRTHNPRGISLRRIQPKQDMEVAMVAVALFVRLEAKPGKEDLRHL